MAWIPGGRQAARALEAPYVDIPEHLRPYLQKWIRASLSDSRREWDASKISRVAMPLRLPLDTDGWRAGQQLETWCDYDENMLDLTEAILEVFKWNDGRAGVLKTLLTECNSIYTTKDDWSGLELRTTPEVKEQVQAVVDGATGSAGDHLANAWNEAYGRVHDPVKSYSESIKAAESTLAGLVSPQNDKQTLGTMIRDVAVKPSKWAFAIDGDHQDGVETVLAMMRLLWEGQTSRHGGVKPTRPETQEEAQAAVHLAATLVQFGVSGAFSAA